MLDGISLDQLRTFIAAAEEGSFSGAGRRLGRSQSVVSELVSTLEARIKIRLFDRSARYPKLTTQGEVILANARGVVSGVDFLKARALGMSQGLEPQLAVAIDVFVPIATITAAAQTFRDKFVGMPLRMFVDALGGVLQPLLDGKASVAIVGPQVVLPTSLSRERIGQIWFTMVAAPSHALALYPGQIPRVELANHVQLVLADRTELSGERDVGVFSASSWRLGDLMTKHAFLLEGLGYGGMPLHMVERDIASNRLKQLDIEGITPAGQMLPIHAVYPTAHPPGPAGRWMIDFIKDGMNAKAPPSLPNSA